MQSLPTNREVPTDEKGNPHPREWWLWSLNHYATCWERGAKLWQDSHGDELRRRAARLRELAKGLETDDGSYSC